jgi:tetratricopeptide (TPR) repeat protein
MRDLAAAIQDAWDFSDPAGSEARFAAMLAEAVKAVHEPAAAEIRTQLARAQGLQRSFAAAHQTLDLVESWLAAQPADHPRIRVRLLLERGRVQRTSGNSAAADPFFTQAFQLASAHSPALDGLAVDAAHMAAMTAAAQSTEVWNNRALALAESSPDPDARRWRASLLNNIGWTHFSSGNCAAALAHFERALAARVEQGTTGKHRGPWLVARWCVAKAKRVLGRVYEALAEQQQLAAAHAAAGTSDGFVSEEIAECLLALGRGAESRPFFAAAHRQLAADPWLSAKEPARIERLKKLGENAA